MMKNLVEKISVIAYVKSGTVYEKTEEYPQRYQFPYTVTENEATEITAITNEALEQPRS